MIGADDEHARPTGGEQTVDAVTVAFGDVETTTFGLLRIGLAGPRRQATALAVLVVEGELVAARARGEIDPGADPDWAGTVEADGLRMETTEPLRTWLVALEGADGVGVTLVIDALTAPLEFEPDDASVQAGGLAGYEQLVHVHGEIETPGGRHAVDALGQRSRAYGEVDWSRLALARTVSAWVDDRRAVALQSIRPAKASDHEHEATTAWLITDGGEGAVAFNVAEPRLSTTYDGDGRQRRAGLELWLTEDDDFPRRAAGSVVAGASLDLGELRLDVAFLDWSMDGRHGAGRYELLRPA